MRMKVATVAAVLWGAAMQGLAQMSGPVTRYVGTCDASAAVEIGKGYFVVGDDEQSTLNIYRLGQPEVVASVSLGAYLGVQKPGADDEETDIEGAARIGNRIYWITSHGVNGKGDPQPNRRRFFATEVIEDAAVPTVTALSTTPHLELLDKVIADRRFGSVFSKASQLPPESEGGLSIEGLAATNDGKLLIGFRNPRPQGDALMLPLDNPAAVLDEGAVPIFGELVRLKLGGRGIRSLEWTGADYLIVAGPHDDRAANPAALSFELYKWPGPGGQPQRVDQKTFEGINPEAIFRVTGSNRYYVLSDDGDTSIDDRKCKSKKVPAERKGFRGLYVE